MIQPQPHRSVVEPAITRLVALGDLDASEIALIEANLRVARTVRPHNDILREGDAIPTRWLMLSGWAARTRVLEDGSRQILNFTLPGDLIGLCDQEHPVAASTIIAIGKVTLCPAPDARERPGLKRAYAMSRAIEEAHLFDQIARLGRMSAEERIEDLLREICERLDLAGLVAQDGFDLPLTQEMLADATGLTPVHVNRTVQHLRKLGVLQWSHGRASIVARRSRRSERRLTLARVSQR